MADDDTTLRVLGIAGSLRAGSFNRALLRAAQELAPGGMEIRAFDIAPIPSTTPTSRPRAIRSRWPR